MINKQRNKRNKETKKQETKKQRNKRNRGDGEWKKSTQEGRKKGIKCNSKACFV
jgi:hypothetical protein